MNYEVLFRVGSSIGSFVERNPELSLIAILCVSACIYRFAMNTRIKVNVNLDFPRRKGGKESHRA